MIILKIILFEIFCFLKMPPNELVPEVNPFDILENQAKPQGCPIS